MMNMNDKDWNKDEEFWDDEAEADDGEEDDCYNGVGNDIDRNNDETFANAAEWNEDEHEELIARDILSQTRRNRVNNHAPQSSNNCLNNNNDNSNNNNNHANNTTVSVEPGPQILMVDELESQLRKTNLNQSTSQPQASRLPEISKRAGWSPFGGKDLFTTLNQNLPQVQSDFGDFFNPAQTLDPEQQQRLILQQHQLLQRQQQQLQLQQFALLQQQHLQQQQQQQHLHHQQRHQQQQQHQHQQLQLQPKMIPPNAKCLTVEELERQMLAGNKKTQETEAKKNPPVHYALMAMEVTPKSNDNHRQIGNDRRNGERHDRFNNRNQRDTIDHREHRDRRDHKNNRDHRYKREPIIIPPQAQRSVIEKAKQTHSLPKIDSGEFLQDRMSSRGEGFCLKKHSQLASEKVNHDGVLTEKERTWLTRIQEKIQADYDDKLDQDYYYLLYFNRSSMRDEAAQKPMGPGVLDRRFIPRERLLYNAGI